MHTETHSQTRQQNGVHRRGGAGLEVSWAQGQEHGDGGLDFGGEHEADTQMSKYSLVP